MKRRRNQIVKASRILTDADPLFVSQVRHGANQTPARIVRSADADNPQAVPVAGHTQKEDLTMAKKSGKAAARPRNRQAAPAQKAAAPAEGTPEIQSMFFPVEHYATEEAVKTYLDDHGYSTDLAVEGDALGWTVKGHEEDEFNADAGFREIEHENVTLTVGFLKEQDAAAKGEMGAAGEGEGGDAAAQAGGDDASTKSAEDAAVEGSETGAQEGADVQGDDPVATEKDAAEDTPVDDLHPFAAIVTDTPSVEFATALATAKAALETMAEGIAPGDTAKKFATVVEVLQLMDDVPPGYYDVMQAFGYVVRSACVAKEFGTIRKAAREMGEYIIQLADLFMAAEPVQESADTGADEQAGADEGTATKSAKLAEVVQAAFTRGKPKAAKAADEPQADADPVAKAILAMAGALDGINQRLERIEVADKVADKGHAPDTQRVERRAEDGGNDNANQSDGKAVSHKYMDSVPDDFALRGLMGIAQKRTR